MLLNPCAFWKITCRKIRSLISTRARRRRNRPIRSTLRSSTERASPARPAPQIRATLQATLFSTMSGPRTVCPAPFLLPSHSARSITLSTPPFFRTILSTATAAVHLRAKTSGERVLTFQLSRALRADDRHRRARTSHSRYFQNEGVEPAGTRASAATTIIHVVLPQPSAKRPGVHRFIFVIAAASSKTQATMCSSSAPAKAGIPTSAIRPNSPLMTLRCAGRTA